MISLLIIIGIMTITIGISIAVDQYDKRKWN